jgi:very-short-patch-repair endonuclease
VIEDGKKSNNFVNFRPRKANVIVGVRLPQSEEVDAELNNAGFDLLEHNGFYRIRLSRNDVKNNPDIIKKLFKVAYDKSNEQA